MKTVSTPDNESPLSRLSVLVPFETSLEHRGQLEHFGARVIACPQLNINAPDDYAPLDEAIENLFGYDWLIFIKSHSASSFLERFQTLGHEISELDSLKVCALGEPTVELLEQSSVHVDVVPELLAAETVVNALANYAGGPASLQGLNFLLPQAAVGREYLKDDLENAGARADVVSAYRTVAGGGSDLTRLKTLILSGSIDCLIFSKVADARDFGALFDANDFSRLLRNVAVACLDDGTREAAAGIGAPVIFKSESASFEGIITAIASHFSR